MESHEAFEEIISPVNDQEKPEKEGLPPKEVEPDEEGTEGKARDLSIYPPQDQWITRSNVHWVFFGVLGVAFLMFYLLYRYLFWTFSFLTSVCDSFDEDVQDHPNQDAFRSAIHFLLSLGLWICALVFVILFCDNIHTFWEACVFGTKDPRETSCVDFIYFYTNPIRSLYLRYGSSSVEREEEGEGEETKAAPSDTNIPLFHPEQK